MSKTKLKPLNLEMDVDLLLEFRQRQITAWKRFCEYKGYEHEVSE